MGPRHWEILRKIPRQVSPYCPIPRTFNQYIDSMEAWEVDLLRDTYLSVDPRSAAFELQEGICAGCDHSEKFGNQGAFGWIVSSPDGERIASGKGPSRGSTLDSYRAECSGMLAIMWRLDGIYLHR